MNGDKELLTLKELGNQLLQEIGVRWSHTNEDRVLDSFFRENKAGIAHSQAKWEHIQFELEYLRHLVGNQCGLCHEFSNCRKCPIGVSDMYSCTDKYSDYDYITREFDKLLKSIKTFTNKLNNLLVKEK